MKAMLVGGGVVSEATLHPLIALAVLLAAVVVARGLWRTWAGRRRRAHGGRT